MEALLFDFLLSNLGTTLFKLPRKIKRKSAQ
jgi:hypothetical protein